MKVYLSENIAESAYKKLSENFEIVTTLDHPEELDAMLVRRTVVTRELMEKATKLKVVSMHGVGIDRIDAKAAAELGIKVTNVPGQNSQSVAELAVSFILALSRKHKYINNGLCKGQFDRIGMDELVGNEITGKKLGLVGGGNVSSRIATIMKNGFNMEIHCYDPYKTEEQCREMGCIKAETVEELFRDMDYVDISVPLAESTRNIINKKVYENANPNLIVVNTSRGGVVNEEDLYEALVSGKIKAAASDVYVTEPPSKDMPLLSLDNFIGTLHVGGTTEEALERVGNCAVDNIINGIAEYEKEKENEDDVAI